MRFGLVGPSYTSRSVAVADEECINLFAENRESGAAVAPARMYGGQATGGTGSLYWTPGLSVFSALPTSPVRASVYAAGRLFAVSGDVLYEIAPSGAYTSRGGVADDGNRASIACNGQQLCIVGGGRAYCYTLVSNVLQEVTSQLVAVPDTVEFDDSYFIIRFQNSSKMQMSALLDGATWPPLYVDAVEVFPEYVSASTANHREMWVFGQRHAQVYQDTGSLEIFDAIPGAFLEIGCVGAFVPCRLDNSVFWIGEDERGGRMAWRSNGYTPTRISTHAVEIDLGSYPSLFGMSTYAYQDGGHFFWVLYIPGSQWSWVYDVTTGLWHKRATWNDVTATWGPHLSWNHVYAFGLHLVGDWSSGNLYVLSQNNLTDNGASIRRLRRSPTTEDELKWMYHSALTLDFDMGNLSTVTPTDYPPYTSSLLGPSPGTSAVNTSLGNTAWQNPGNVLGTSAKASVQLVATVNNAASTTATGTSSGGGVPWTNPGNIDSNSVYATASLSAGGSPIDMFFPPVDGRSGPTVSASANPSNQNPTSVTQNISGFPSTAATDITLYITVAGTISASQGGGILTLNYSDDGGATWNFVQSWNATFSSTTVPVPISGISNLNTVQVQIIANASCGPSGYSNASLSCNAAYAIVSGSSQPTSQTLTAAISGLTIPAGQTVVGFAISLNTSASAPTTMRASLSVGGLPESVTLPSSGTVSLGGSSDLWGYNNWTAAALSTLKINLSASTTGTCTVYLNTLTVTVYYVQTNIPSDALDITGFGFTVPDGQAASGFSIALMAHTNTVGATITVQMLKAGVPTGNPQTLPLNTSDMTVPFGGDNSLFGGTWISGNLEAPNFGIRVTATATNGQTATVYVGYTTLQIYAPPTVLPFSDVGQPPVLLDGNGNPRPPQVMVRWSDNRGHTWSNEHIVDCGNAGEYNARAIVRRLGRSRGRVYEVSATDPIPWVLVDGYVDVTE